MTKQAEFDKNCHKIQVHTPSLKDMRPFPKLLNMSCPWDLDGQCGSCSKFQGMLIPDGAINSSSSYEGYCHKKVDIPKFKFKKGDE